MSIESRQKAPRETGTFALDGRGATPIVLSPAEEKRLARELSPRVAWPTLVLAVALPASYLAIAQLGWDRTLPLWACGIVLTAVAYSHYTLVHEAVHDNLVPGRPKLRWVNGLVGWIGALTLGFSWPVMMRTHLLHHAHTNTDEDPDIYVKGSFRGLMYRALKISLLAQVPLFLMRVVAPQRHRASSYYLQGSEALQSDLVVVALWASLVLFIAIGRVTDLLWLFLIPAIAANIILTFFFSWLPHHPFDRTERYLNTRISLWRGGGVLTLQQNYHLVHHLWPGVPFYNYGRLYRRLRPVLTAKGSRVEGFWPGAPAQERSHPA